MGEYERLTDNSYDFPTWPYNVKRVIVDKCGKFVFLNITITVVSQQTSFVYTNGVNDIIIPKTEFEVLGTIMPMSANSSDIPVMIVIKPDGRIGVAFGTVNRNYFGTIMGVLTN